MKTYPKTCLNCEAPFTTPAKKLMYCSPFCNVEHRVLSLKLSPRVCWEWPGSRDQAGYGHVRWNGKLRKSHRLAHGAFKGPIPRRMLIMHSCDNPSCCNPNHLFIGTHAENMRDMAAKGRASREGTTFGERHHEARFKERDIPAVRKRFAGGESMRSIARSFGVTHEAVRKIVRKETWMHIE